MIHKKWYYSELIKNDLSWKETRMVEDPVLQNLMVQKAFSTTGRTSGFKWAFFQLQKHFSAKLGFFPGSISTKDILLNYWSCKCYYNSSETNSNFMKLNGKWLFFKTAFVLKDTQEVERNSWSITNKYSSSWYIILVNPEIKLIFHCGMFFVLKRYNEQFQIKSVFHST